MGTWAPDLERLIRKLARVQNVQTLNRIHFSFSNGPVCDFTILHTGRTGPKLNRTTGSELHRDTNSFNSFIPLWLDGNGTRTR
jgi:hypothetical protein